MNDPWITGADVIAEGPRAKADVDGGARALTLDEATAMLASPDDRSSLARVDDVLTDGAGRRYPIVGGRPWLLPAKALTHVVDGSLQIATDATYRDALAQYLYLGAIKASGWAANSEYDDPWFLRHMRRASDLLAPASGLVLDVGCDDPGLSRRLFPATARYIGLEPSLEFRRGFSVAGMAEWLPFADGAFDGVSLMTSLDHVLDYHAAIDEAHRVLRPGGSLYLATLIWNARAELYRDNIHFHHFREFEIRGALSRFQVRAVTRYGWKGDTHRQAVYIHAVKQETARAGRV